jgi:hypothetical protein
VLLLAGFGSGQTLRRGLLKHNLVLQQTHAPRTKRHEDLSSTASLGNAVDRVRRGRVRGLILERNRNKQALYASLPALLIGLVLLTNAS